MTNVTARSIVITGAKVELKRSTAQFLGARRRWGGLSEERVDSDRLLGGEVLEDHLAEELGIADARGGVEDFEAGETSVGVVVRGDALGQVLGARGRVPELDEQGIDLFVVGDSHGATSEEVDVDSDNNDLIGLIHEYGPDLLDQVLLASPSATEGEVGVALEATAFCGAPLRLPNRLSYLGRGGSPRIQPIGGVS